MQNALKQHVARETASITQTAHHVFAALTIHVTSEFGILVYFCLILTDICAFSLCGSAKLYLHIKFKGMRSWFLGALWHLERSLYSESRKDKKENLRRYIENLKQEWN